MRRLLVLTAAVLLLGAGCTADSGTDNPSSVSSPSGGVPATGPTTVPPGDPRALAGNGEQVCADARRLTTEKITAFITELGRSLQAVSAGDTAVARKARRAAEKAVEELVTGLRAQAAKADDTQLKAALNEAATTAATLTADLQKVDDTRLDEVQRRLEQLCGV